MSLDPPQRMLTDLLSEIGSAGQRINEIEASEGAAGNISVCIGWSLDVRSLFPEVAPITLPLPAPALAGMYVIASGAGQRLRDIRTDPAAHLGVVEIAADGQSGLLYTAPQRTFTRITTEFNTHLAVHNDQVARNGFQFHALLHAQPLHITFLSHIPAYREQAFFNRHLLRWEPETIINFPEGIGMLPYVMPGSPALMEASLIGLRTYRLVVWSKHGVITRSHQSVMKAVDWIEYAETAARYEYMNLSIGNQAEGLTVEEIREVAREYHAPEPPL